MPSHVGARTALQALPVERRTPSFSARRSRCWSRSTRRTTTSPGWSRSSGSSSRTRRRPTSASACCCGSASSKASSATPTRRGMRTRARSAESPASAPAREALENLANILDNWQPLVALYEKALSVKGKERLPPALERELLLVVAVAYDEKLAQSDRAVEYFRRAQSIQPEDASALVALERLYTRTERWSDLVDTLLKKAQLVTDDAEREEIRIRIARVWEEMLGNAEQAIVAWNVVLQDNPANVQALRALDRLYMPRGEHRELADNLQRQLNLVAGEPAETVALLGRLGALREQYLGQLGRRRRHLRQDPADPAGAQRDHRGARADPPESGARAGRRAAAGADLQGPRRLAAADRGLRGRGAPRRRSGAEDRALQADRRRLRDRAGRSGARLRGVGAGARRGSAESGRPGERRAAGSRAAQAGRPDRTLRAAGRRRSPIPSARTRSITRSLAWRSWSWATTRRRRQLISRRWMCGRAIWTRRTRWSSCICGAPTIPTW